MDGVLSLLALFSGILGAANCNHQVHPVTWPQLKHEIPNGVSVGIGSSEVSEGEKLLVYESNCRPVVKAGPAKLTECIDKEVGTAVVVKVVSRDSSVVEPQNGLVMKRSMIVKRPGG